VASVLDGGFDVVRYRFTTIAIVTACIVIPLNAVPTVLSILRVTERLDDLSEAPSVSLGIGLGGNSDTALSLLSFLGSSIALALMGVAIGHLVSSWLTGNDPGPGEVLRVVGRRSGVALIAWFVAMLLKGLSFLLCGFGLLITLPMFVVLSPIVAVEGLGPLASVRRSWKLSGRRVLTMLVLVIASVLLTFAFQVIVFFLGTVIQGQVIDDATWSWVVLGVLSFGFALFLAPVQAAWAVLAYFDLRVRSEGLDLEMAAGDVFDRSR
jgi:MFS family permease